MNTATYPLVYTDDEGVTHTAQTAEELALIAEFVDDRDPVYMCRDAKGKRVRLIIWALQVVLEQTVPEEFDIQALRVERVAEGSGFISVEVHAGKPLRALKEEGENVRAINDAEQEGISPPRNGELVDAAEFHRAWMRASVGEAYKP